jgi:hypothetical protein
MARKQPPRTRVPAFIWVLGGILALAIGYRAMSGRDSGRHPQPRADVTADAVVAADRYASAPDVARVYSMAHEIPEVLDGLHCYCDCARNFGHRSLLTCFESDHGAGCDICLREAAIAAEMHSQGASLNQIRDRIDGMFAG